MLTDLNTALALAEQKGCAIPAFNVYNAETALGVLMQVWDALRSAGYSVNDVPARIQRAQP